MAETLGQAAITGVNPGSMAQGATATVEITGNKTNFSAASVVSFSGAGIAAGAVAVFSGSMLQVTLTVDPSAPAGPSDVTVTTGGEVATGPGLFTITPRPTAFVSPANAMRGTDQTVQITGQHTHFDSTTVVSFEGAGITISAVSVLGPATLRATITIDPSAPLGTSGVTVTTGTEVATGGLFTVELNPALVKITSVNPGSAAQGATDLVVQITGQHTNFDATSVVSFEGAGVTLSAFHLVSATEMEATLSVDSSAPTGSSDVTVTTGEEVAIGSGVFTVVTSAAEAEVLREAVNTYLRRLEISDPVVVAVCERFIRNVNEALRAVVAGTATGIAVKVGVKR